MDKKSENLSQCEEAVLVYAARYARGRHTGAALPVVSAIIANLDRISDHAKSALLREHGEAVYNLDDWERLRAAILRRGKSD